MATIVPTMQELLEAGVHFGHKVSRGHPKMSQFIYGARDGVHIIDLAKSEEKLKEAVDFVFNLGKEGKALLVVATKKQAKEIVESLVIDSEVFYITSRWVGGLLTNFDEIKKNLKKLNALKDEQEKGLLSRYTKKEQLLISRRLEKYNQELGGVAKLQSLPDAIFVVDAVAEDIAIREANKTGIKVVAFADTNSNPANVDYPIPANDDGIKSIKIICEAVIKAYQEGRMNNAVKGEKEKAAPEKEEKQTDGITKDVVEETALIEEDIEKKIVDEAK